MINSVNQSPAFGSKCMVILPSNRDLESVLAIARKKNPNFRLKFVEPSAKKVILAEDEFTYVGKSDIKNTPMARFLFEDGNKCDNQYAFQLKAFLKSAFGENRVVACEQL